MTIAQLNDGSLEFETYEPQFKFLNLNSRFVGFIAGVGAGKTIAGSLFALRRAMRKPCKGIVATRTYPLLRDVIIDTIRTKVFPPQFIEDYNKNEAIMELINGSKIYFRPLESERQIDRIRGYSINWAWVDEAPYIPYYAIKVINARLREGENQQLAITGTPKGYNWAFEKFEEPDRKIPRLEDELQRADTPENEEKIREEIEELKEIRRKWQAIKEVSSEDNPYLPEDYLDSLRSQYAGDFAAQELQGKFVKFEGLIYKEFERGEHIIPQRKVDEMNFSDFIMGYDAGYSNPRVLLKIGKNEKGEWVVVDEFYRRESMLSDAIDKFRDMGGGTYTIFADPSAKGNIEEMRSEGLNVEPADNEVAAGIQEVKSKLDHGELKVAEICQNTINEFGSYQWKGEPDDPEDEPKKEMDHAMDALRYALNSYKGGMGFGSVSAK